MSTNLQSKRASLPEPEAQLDAKAVAADQQDVQSTMTAPHTEEQAAKVDEAQPTVVEARQDMVIAKEEVFGPVIAAIGYDEPEEAVALANDNPYGLSAYVYSRDVSQVLTVSRRLQAGRVLVNGAPPPYPSIPEGGRKASGYGRDQGPESLDGYLDTKAVIITAE